MRFVHVVVLAGVIALPACRRRAEPEFLPLPSVAPAPVAVAATVPPPAPPSPPPFVPSPFPAAAPAPPPVEPAPELPPIGSVPDGGAMAVLRGDGAVGVATADPSGLDAAVRAAGGAIQRCLDEAPALATGRDVNLRVRYRVLPEGRTDRVEVEGEGALPDAARGCVRRAVEAMKVPPQAGGPVEAAFPITYRRDPAVP